ncbi:Rho GTPase-activating protein 6 [Liparis tanakae]|uniref:Rho GTPase-activating protein 6 n=1 Tax=Liparis tanakae TaxID=230148 RepID=A0A4Z2HME4_9TELE|nr:Rho GTPase-activating protein 6 [Liparis tanakae]
MTSLNLATIFGPNLLHKKKNSDKEFAVQSFARAEESNAIISVVQKMIDIYDMLFMNEVLMSVQESDPDVVDYLLRRKASQYSEPGLLGAEDSFSLAERYVSSDSIKASSGEVSPYDNNSPVLSDRLLCKYPEEGGPLSDGSPRLSGRYQTSGRSKDGSGCTSPTLSTDKDFLGDVSECESYGSSEWLSSRQGIRQTSLDVLESRPRPPVTRSCSASHDQKGQRQPQPSLHPGSGSQSAALRSDASAERTGQRACPSLRVRTDGVAPPPHSSGRLREAHKSYSTPSVFIYESDTQSPAPPSADASGPGADRSPGTPDWQTQRWHIWNTLSKENADALPETLV